MGISRYFITARKLKDKFIYNLRNYVENCNLHGCRYILDKKYNDGVSLCWTLILIISFAFCFYLIFLQLRRFQETAVLNSITSTGYPVWKDPFPAVTVCNSNVVYKNKTGSIIAALASEDVGEADALEFLSNLSNLILCVDCDDVGINFNLTKQMQIEKKLQHIGYNIDSLMQQLAHPCESMLKKCIWKSEEKPCTEIFQSIKTTMGYCCAFNYFGIAKYQNEFDKALFSGGFGFNSGLQIVIDIEADQYLSTINGIPGVDILIRHGTQYAEFGTDSYALRSDRFMSVGVQPNVFMADRDLKYLKDVTRACWFNKEGNLKWTKMYNQLTCFNECKANYILRICHCIPFYYALTGKEKICTFEHLPCLLYNKAKFSNLMLTSNLEEDANYARSVGMTNAEFCYCLPNCNDVQYTLHPTKKQLNQANGTCSLSVHFNNIAGILRLRIVHVTWDTLLAMIGGIFGLCMGGSVVTVFELIFFVLLAISRKYPNVNNEDETSRPNSSHKFIL